MSPGPTRATSARSRAVGCPARPSGRRRREAPPGANTRGAAPPPARARTGATSTARAPAPARSRAFLWPWVVTPTAPAPTAPWSWRGTSGSGSPTPLTRTPSGAWCGAVPAAATSSPRAPPIATPGLPIIAAPTWASGAPPRDEAGQAHGRARTGGHRAARVAGAGRRRLGAREVRVREGRSRQREGGPPRAPACAKARPDQRARRGGQVPRRRERRARRRRRRDPTPRTERSGLRPFFADAGRAERDPAQPHPGTLARGPACDGGADRPAVLCPARRGADGPGLEPEGAGDQRGADAAGA